MEDLSECFNQLFFEEEHLIKFDIAAFYTAKKNEALIVNKFVYHFKKSNEKSKSERWVCRSCSASLTTLNDDIIKINGKTAVFDKDLASYHKHEAISAEEVSQILSFERIKNRVMQTNEPILKIFEQEEIAMAKAGKSTKEIADL